MRYGHSYHDTVPVSDVEIREVKAKKQEAVVMDFFKRNPNVGYTPYQVWELTGLNKRSPVTSVRRAMTNLTPHFLTKLESKKKERYGSENCLWMYVKFPEQTSLFDVIK